MFSIILPDVIITGNANTQIFEIKRNLMGRMNISNMSGIHRIVRDESNNNNVSPTDSRQLNRYREYFEQKRMKEQKMHERRERERREDERERTRVQEEKIREQHQRELQSYREEKHTEGEKEKKHVSFDESSDMKDERKKDKQKKPTEPPDYTKADKFIDVHTFDGQLYEFKPLRNYSSEEIRHKIQEFSKELTIPQAISSISTILNDMPSSGGLYSNYQHRDNIRADVILADILYLGYDDVFNQLEEQLADISVLGLCNSGRVNRLYQIWLALRTNHINKERRMRIESEE